jgi:hypothetical protein
LCFSQDEIKKKQEPIDNDEKKQDDGEEEKQQQQQQQQHIHTGGLESNIDDDAATNTAAPLFPPRQLQAEHSEGRATASSAASPSSLSLPSAHSNEARSLNEVRSLEEDPLKEEEMRPDCYAACGGKDGPCTLTSELKEVPSAEGFCGQGGACCRLDFEDSVGQAACGFGTLG